MQETVVQSYRGDRRSGVRSLWFMPGLLLAYGGSGCRGRGIPADVQEAHARSESEMARQDEEGGKRGESVVSLRCFGYGVLS